MKSNGITKNDEIIHDKHETWELRINSNNLFCATGSSIEIYNITGERTLKLQKSINFGMNIREFCVDVRGVLYARSSWQYVSLYYHPTSVSEMGIVSQINALGGSIIDYCVHDNLLYIAHGYMGLVIYNVTDFTSPVFLSRILIGDSVKHVFVEDSKAYIISDYYPTSYHGFAVVDVSDPVNPKIEVLESGIFTEVLRKVYVSEGYIFVLADDGLYSININGSNVSYEILNVLDLPFDYSMQDGIMHISQPYLVTEISLTIPSSPVLSGLIYTNVFGWSIAAYGNQTFVADGVGGFVRLSFPYPTPTPTITYIISFKIFLFPICFTSILIVVVYLKHKKRTSRK